MTPSAGTAPDRLAPELVEPLQPLIAAYARSRLPLPRIDPVPAGELPEPYRALLAHDRDMTPTLEAFHRSEIHIEVWSRAQRENQYLREVVLRLDRNQRPVEFGANRVYLDAFEPSVRKLILDEYLPLGQILRLKAIPHAGHPTAFLRVEPDAQMRRAFGLHGAETRALYGRCNTIRDPQNRPLSQIVEILCPV